jgi:hypothetical protein
MRVLPSRIIMSVYDKIFENLMLRKAYHLFGGGVILAALATLDRPTFIICGIIYLIAFWVLGKRVSFAMLGVLLLLAFSRSQFITMGATIVFWIGDGSAALVGSWWRGKSWSWNKAKTIAGSLAFLTSSGLALFLFLILVSPSPKWGLVIAASLTALGGTLAEGLPITLIKDRKADDNLLIIMTSGILLQMVALALGIELPMT